MLRSLVAMMGVVALMGAPRIGVAQEDETAPPALPPNVCPPGMQPVPGAVQAMPPGQTMPPAQALPPGQVCPPPQVYYLQPPATVVRPRRTFSPDNWSLTLGGGVANFARERISDSNSAVAGTWDFRYLYGTRTIVGVEAAYEGTEAGSGPVATNGSVETHQLSGNFRLNMTRARIQPFVTAGAGWANLRRSLPATTTGAEPGNSTNSFVAPFGAGIAGYIGKHGVVDVRGSYDLVTNKDFTNTGARPDIWSAELRAGYAF